MTSANSSTARRCDPTSASTCSASEPPAVRRRDPVRRPDTIRAIPLTVDLKGLVFYPKAEFEAAGYEVPASWDELIALSHQIVADGGTPWCFGFASRLRQWMAGLRPARESGATGGRSRHLRRVDRRGRRVHEPGRDGGRPAGRRPDLRARLRSRRPGIDQQRELRQPAVPHAESQRGRPARPSRSAGCTTRPTSCSGSYHRGPGSARTSTSSCFLRSIRISRPRPPVVVCSRRRWSTGPRSGRSWSSWRVPSGARSGRRDADGSFISANRRFDISTYGDAAEDPAAAVRIAMASAARTALAADVVEIRRLGSDAGRDRRLDRRRRPRRVLARNARLGRRDPHHRSGLRRHRRRVGRARKRKASRERSAVPLGLRTQKARQ